MKKLLILFLIVMLGTLQNIEAQGSYTYTMQSGVGYNISTGNQYFYSLHSSSNIISIINNTIIFSDELLVSAIIYYNGSTFLGHTSNSSGGRTNWLGTLDFIPSNATGFRLMNFNEAVPGTNSPVTPTQFANLIVYYEPAMTYPGEVNLDSNYGDYFDVNIQYQDQDEQYLTYPISAEIFDVNDDWQATAPTSNIGSFVFQHWFDLDNNIIFSTNSSLSITSPSRNYNLRAIYSGVAQYDIDLNMESGISGNIQYQGNSFTNQSVNQLASVIDQTVPNGTAWQASAPNVAGQVFDGWFNANNTLYSSSQNIQINSTTSNFDLEARYSPVPTYTFNATSDLPNPPNFQYQVNGGSSQSAYPVSITINEGSSVNIVAPTSGIGFYQFDGWYNTSDNSFISSNDTLTYNNITQNISIEARYTLPEEYQINLTLTSQIGNIQFQIDGQATIFAPSISETVFAGQSFQATAPDDPTNYQFIHWFDLDNNIVFSQNLFITAQDVDRDYVLEARYAEIFDITFDSNGGSPINSDTALDGEMYVLPTPTRAGFIFLGWIDGNDPLPAPIVQSPYEITQDTEFIAQWSEIFEVIFNSNGGTFVPSQLISASGIVTEPVTPSKFGYLFDGWFTDNGTFANEYNFAIPVSSAFVLHAKWVLGSDSDIGQTLNDWIDNSGVTSLFIVIVILLAVTITLGIINAKMFVIIITNLSLLFVFGALGFIPIWILLLAGLAVIGFIIMIVFGGNNNG